MRSELAGMSDVFGLSWCCRMPLIPRGGHWECTRCGKSNACAVPEPYSEDEFAPDGSNRAARSRKFIEDADA